MEHKSRFSASVARGENPRSAIVQAVAFACEYLAQANIPERTKVRSLVVVEELVSNVLRHCDPARDVNFVLELDAASDALVIELNDDSFEFDMSRKLEFTGPDPVEGGSVGLAIVHAWGQDMSYDRRDGLNQLRLKVR